MDSAIQLSNNRFLKLKKCVLIAENLISGMNGTAHVARNGSVAKENQTMKNGFVQDIHFRQRQTER